MMLKTRQQARRSVIFVAFFCALVQCFGGAASADSSDERFLDGLHRRRLFRLAESFCRDRLADERLSAVERAELTNLQIRAVAQDAIYSTPQRREARWTTARTIAADFFQENPTNPRLSQVKLQDALTVLARGELARMEAEVGSRLATGMDLSEIAEALGITIYTVRGHLKQLFAKTETHRQAELVRVILAGPARIRPD